MKSSPLSPQLEKDSAKQGRHSTAKNKKIIIKNIINKTEVAENTFFSSSPGTFTRIYHKTSVNNTKKTKVISSIFFRPQYSKTRDQLQGKKKRLIPTSIWQLKICYKTTNNSMKK